MIVTTYVTTAAAAAAAAAAAVISLFVFWQSSPCRACCFSSVWENAIENATAAAAAAAVHESSTVYEQLERFNSCVRWCWCCCTSSDCRLAEVPAADVCWKAYL